MNDMQYDLNTYMLPYWEGNTVHHEAVLPVENPDGTLPDIPLLYKADKILCVCSADLQTEYRAGTDYVLADGKLQIPAGSALPRMSYADYYPAQENGTCKKLNEQYGDGYIFFTESSRMHELQLAVTYTHKDSFAGPIPVCKATLLPQFTQKLRKGEPLQICLYGDSICVGGNSSAFLGVPPMAPIWFDMVSQKLQQRFPDTLFFFQNPSLGGQTSQWGAEQAADRVGYGPDLCLISFGMNDGTRRIMPEAYLQNICGIMAAARQGNPDCEFVLIAPTIPNGQVGKFLGYQAEYLPLLQTLEGPGVAVADMTGFHQYLLTRKRFYDMSANNVNHPNDFLARAYAQVVWQTIMDDRS